MEPVCRLERVKQFHDFMEPVRRETLPPTGPRIPALGHELNPRACDLKAGEANIRAA
jgi:hypothetical protein